MKNLADPTSNCIEIKRELFVQIVATLNIIGKRIRSATNAKSVNVVNHYVVTQLCMDLNCRFVTGL